MSLSMTNTLQSTEAVPVSRTERQEEKKSHHSFSVLLLQGKGKTIYEILWVIFSTMLTEKITRKCSSGLTTVHFRLEIVQSLISLWVSDDKYEHTIFYKNLILLGLHAPQDFYTFLWWKPVCLFQDDIFDYCLYSAKSENVFTVDTSAAYRDALKENLPQNSAPLFRYW